MLTIYYRHNCPYSMKALEYIKKKNFECVIRNVDEHGGQQNVLNALQKKTDISKNHNTKNVF